MLWIELVNSNWYDHLTGGVQADRIEETAWQREIAKRAGLPRLDWDESTMDELRKLRTLLARLVSRVLTGKPLGARELNQLNGYLNVLVRPRVRESGDSFSLQLQPTEDGVQRLLFELASSFAEFLIEGDLKRLKACANGNCRWVFYDTSKSRTRRWCATNCGNLVKVREFRRRMGKAARSTSR